MVADRRRLCVTCKKLITRGLNGRRKYCSERCSLLARAPYRRCLVCSAQFKNPNNRTACCSPECSSFLRKQSHARFYVERRKARRQQERHAKTSNHLDSVPNPFAGALNARERRELNERLQYIRRYKATMGSSMGGAAGPIRRRRGY